MKQQVFEIKVELLMKLDMRNWLMGHAKANGMSLSEYIRSIIREKQAC